MPELILASVSPRRKRLLGQITSSFRVEPSAYEEVTGEAEYVAKTNAEGKAREVFFRFPEAIVLGADTVVSLNGRVYGKPKDGAQAKQMLLSLSGRTHTVITGICLIAKDVFFSKNIHSEVTFYELTEEEILSYIETGSPFDKAGAYGIDDGVFIRNVKGSKTNVAGLPVEEVRSLLKEIGYVKACD